MSKFSVPRIEQRFEVKVTVENASNYKSPEIKNTELPCNIYLFDTLQYR